MLRSLPSLAAAAGVLLLIGNVPANASAATKKSAAEQRILNTLEDETRLEFIDTPLRDVVEFLKDLHGIPIAIENKALEEFGLGSDTPITINLRGLTLRSALKLMLDDLDLTYVVRDEVLMLTTREAAEASLLTRIYLVSDLLKSNAESTRYPGCGETLIKVIVATVTPDAWAESGGPGSIMGASLGGADMLVVSQTMEVHTQLGELLAKLRDAVSEAKALKEAAREAREGDESGEERYGNDPFGAGFGGGAEFEEALDEENDPPVPREKDKDAPVGGSDPFSAPEVKDNPPGRRPAAGNDPFGSAGSNGRDPFGTASSKADNPFE